MDKKTRNMWWGPPRNYADKLSDRKISWLELFYDLVYVAIIAQLTAHLSLDLTVHGLMLFSFLFILILWSWMNGAYYHDTHGNTGIRTRFLTLWQMLAVASVAITINDLFIGQFKGFAISFSILSLMITYLWWSQTYYDPSHKVLSRYYVLTYCFTTILFISSIFTSTTIAHLLWGIGLVLNINVNFIAAPSSLPELKRRGMVTNVSASMVERFGLFTIIVLGETLMGVVYGISVIPDKSLSIWFSFIMGVLITFLLWWIYFDMLGECKPKVGFIYMQLLNFIHIGLLASFAVIGATMRIILSNTSPSIHDPAKRIFGVAIMIILLSIAALSSIMEDEEQAPMILVMKKLNYMLIGTSVLILIITVSCSFFNTLFFIFCIALVLLIPVLIGTRLWVHHKIFADKTTP